MTKFAQVLAGLTYFFMHKYDQIWSPDGVPQYI